MLFQTAWNLSRTKAVNKNALCTWYVKVRGQQINSANRKSPNLRTCGFAICEPNVLRFANLRFADLFLGPWMPWSSLYKNFEGYHLRICDNVMSPRIWEFTSLRFADFEKTFAWHVAVKRLTVAEASLFQRILRWMTRLEPSSSASINSISGALRPAQHTERILAYTFAARWNDGLIWKITALHCK